MDELFRSRPPSFSERPRPAPLVCASVDYCEPEKPVERSITLEKEEIEYHTNALITSSLPLSEIQELLRLINKIAFNNSFYHSSFTPMSSLLSPKADYSSPRNPLHLILPLIEPNAGGETVSTTARVIIDLFQHGDGLSDVVVKETEFIILLFDLAKRYVFIYSFLTYSDGTLLILCLYSDSFNQLDSLFDKFTTQVSSSVRAHAKLILVGKTHSHDVNPSESVDKDEIDMWCKLRQNIMASVVFLEYSSLYAQGVRDLLSLIVEPFQAQLNAHHTKLQQLQKKKKESPIQVNSLQFFNKPPSQVEETAEAESKRINEEKLRDLRAKKVYDIEQAMQENLLADWQESETLAAQYELQLLQSRSEDTPPQNLGSSSSILRMASSNLSILIDSNIVNVVSPSPKRDLASMVEAMHAPRDEHALYLSGMQLNFENEDDLFALDEDEDEMMDQDAHWKLSTPCSTADNNSAAAALVTQQQHQTFEHQSSSDSAIYDSQSSAHHNDHLLLLGTASTSLGNINAGMICNNIANGSEMDDVNPREPGATIVGGERRTRRRWYNFFSCSS